MLAYITRNVFNWQKPKSIFSRATFRFSCRGVMHMPEPLELSPTDRVYRDSVGNLLVIRGQGEAKETYFLYAEMGSTIAAKCSWVATHTGSPSLLQVDYGFFTASLSVGEDSCAFVGAEGDFYSLIEPGGESRPASIQIRTREELAEIKRQRKQAERKRRKHKD